MKSAEEKIQFKNHFFKLGQGRVMTDDDIAFWLILLNTPSDASEIYDLLTANDIKTVRDQNLPNFLLLIRIVSVNLVKLCGSVNPSSTKQLLNCIRFLTKTLPFCFELPSYRSDIELPLFWDSKFDPTKFLILGTTNKAPLPLENTIEHHEKSIAYELIHSLISLLFVPGFTIESSSNSSSSSGIRLWESGIGSSAPYTVPNPILDCNRTEVLKLLLTLCSTPLYQVPSKVVGEGSRFLTVLVSTLPKHLVISLLCSLINITCRSARYSALENGLLFDNELLKELRYFCVTYSAQLLCAMLVYPMPSTVSSEFLYSYGVLTKPHKPANNIRLFFGKLSKESEVLFLASHLLNVLRYPIHTLKDESQKKQPRVGYPSLWSLEALVILWELLQCNKTFRATTADRFIPRLVPYIIYHIFSFYDSPPHEALVKLFAYLLLYITSEQSWVASMIALETPTDGFPPELKMASSGTTRDSTVLNVCQIIMALTANSTNATSRYHEYLLLTLVNILYNLIPQVNTAVEGTNLSHKGMSNTNPGGGLSAKASTAVNRVVARFANPAFLVQNESRPELLALVLRALCAAATKAPNCARMVLFSFLCNEKMYDHVWNVIHGLDQNHSAEDHLDDVSEVAEEELSATTDTNGLDKDNDEGRPPFNNSVSNSTDEISGESKTTSQESIDTEAKARLEEEARRREQQMEDYENEALEIAEALRPSPLTGMSSKVKEKLPMGAPLPRSWGGNDALRVIITIIIPQIKIALKDVWAKRHDCNYDNFFIVKQIEHSDMKDALLANKTRINYDFQPNTPIEKLHFSWSHLSLGWYVSQLYWSIFNSHEHVKSVLSANNTIMKNISSSIMLFGKIASSWSGITNSLPGKEQGQNAVLYVETNFNRNSPWTLTNPRLFLTGPEEDDGFINPFISKLGQGGQNIAMADLTNSLARRFSDFRLGSRSLLSSGASGQHNDDHERLKLTKRNSVSSLHSLNTLNRTRSNTPRNSMSL